MKLLFNLIFCLIFSHSQSQENINNKLINAVNSCDSITVKTLLLEGANINAIDTNGSTPLMLAGYGCDTVMVKLLIKNNADVKAVDFKGRAAIHYASLGDTSRLHIIIKNGADVNAKTPKGFTPLMYAAVNNNYDNCVLLWKSGADIKIKNDDDRSALDIARLNGLTKITDLLKNIEEYNAISQEDYLKKLEGKRSEYYNAGDYKNALPYAEKALELAGILYGKNNSYYTNSLNWTAYLYSKTGDNNKAMTLYQEALKINKKVLGEKDPEYATSLNNLALRYYNMNNYDKAESLFLEAAKIRKEVLGDKNPDYLSTIEGLANLYKTSGKYDKAEPLYLELIITQKEILGSKHPDYAKSLSNFAGLYIFTGKYDKAEPLYFEALKIFKDSLGENSTKYAAVLINVAILYQKKGNYIRAEQIYLEAIKIDSAAFGKNSPDYAEDLDSFANLYEVMGHYERSEQLYLESLKILKESLGDNNLKYAVTLNDLGTLYYTMGNYTKTESLYLEALKITKEIFGENSPHYAMNLYNLGTLYSETGNFEESESLLLKTLELRKEISGVENHDYAMSLYSLGGLYRVQGKFEKAEPLYLEAIRIQKEVSGDKNPFYASILNDMARLYQKMGNYEKAESLFLEAINIQRETLGDKNPSYAMTIDNLSSLYKKMGNYEKATPLAIEAYRIRKEVLGEKHPDYAISLSNLGGLYSDIGNYEESEKNYVEALQIYKDTYGGNSSDYSICLSNLALLYKVTGKFEKAEPLYLEALKNVKSTYGENSQNYGNAVNDLARLSASMGNYEKAEPLYIKANKIILNQIDKNYSFLSEEEKQNFLETVSYNFEMLNSFILNRKLTNPSVTEMAFNNEIALNGSLLQSSLQMRQSILNSEDTTLISKFNLWMETKKYINTVMTLSDDELKKRRINMDSLTEKANTLEKELTVKSNVFKEQVRKVNWEDIKKSLKPGEAVVEFINFDYYNYYTRHWPDSNLYAALIIRDDSRYPEFVPLFEEKKLQEYLTGLAINDTSRGFQLNEKKSSTSSQGALNPWIYDLIWNPIETYLKGVDIVYITPSGQLYKLSFAGLKVDSAAYLCDRYNIYTMLSSRDILKLKNEPKTTETNNYTASVYGGADYDLAYDKIKVPDSANSIKTEDMVAMRSVSLNLRGNGSFGYLKGTKIEAENIKNILAENKFNVSLYTGNTAAEGIFKSLSGTFAPQIIHIATHGFFLPSPDTTKNKESVLTETNKFTKNDNPLMRTGLMFSGANNVWAGKETPKDIDDGVLTAYEVSNLNLMNTKLAVLSACETGLGDIKAGEGVFGLQRAFKLAGVGKIIMSKWPVPDAETVELMEAFYSGWMNGLSIHDAFTKAQQKMRFKYPDDPAKWAAFVLIE